MVRSTTARFPHKKNNIREKVYDLTVEGCSSFVVGLAVVHNCHRIGQTNSVNIYHLVLKDSLDAHMAGIIVRKQEMIARAINLGTKKEPVTAPVLPEVTRVQPTLFGNRQAGFEW